MEEQIFEIIEEKTCADLTEEEIQEWIDVSNKYRSQDRPVRGMHGGDCTEACENCCDLCNSGHTIITGTSNVNGNEVTSMISCTKKGCTGKYL